MCTTVIYSGREFETVEELKEICPILIQNRSYECIKEDYCLCQLNLIATAKINGFQYSMFDCGDVEFRR